MIFCLHLMLSKDIGTDKSNEKYVSSSSLTCRKGRKGIQATGKIDGTSNDNDERKNNRDMLLRHDRRIDA